MSTDQGDIKEVNIPSTATAVVAEFQDREKADAAVEALAKAGIHEDHVSFVARGAEYEGDKFVPGALLITVHADGHNEEAERILRDAGAVYVKSGVISATGEVVEEHAEEREEASSG